MISKVKRYYKRYFKTNQSIEVSAIEESLLSEILNTKIDSIPFFCFKGESYIIQLVEKKKAVFNINNGIIIVLIDNILFNVNSWEELLILKEVFIDGIYNVFTPEKFCLVDIGMNVGITSLFFANKSNCDSVIAFEPFEKTRALAQKNFLLNAVSSKIEIRNYGVGYPPRELEVKYSMEYKGSVGINGLSSYIMPQSELDNELLEIRDVSDAINSIIENNNNVILKIDCEGAEYEILNRLDALKILPKIKYLMIEWHIEGPHFLIDILNSNNFFVLSFNENEKDIGMIYACKIS
jgi:FkbM family methyltransferase